MWIQCVSPNLVRTSEVDLSGKTPFGVLQFPITSHEFVIPQLFFCTNHGTTQTPPADICDGEHIEKHRTLQWFWTALWRTANDPTLFVHFRGVHWDDRGEPRRVLPNQEKRNTEPRIFIHGLWMLHFWFLNPYCSLDLVTKFCRGLSMGLPHSQKMESLSQCVGYNNCETVFPGIM